MTNEAVMGDLGWWELKARRDKARLKLYKRLLMLEDKDYGKLLVKHKDSEWREYSDNLLRSLNLDTVDMISQTDSEFRKCLTDRTQKKRKVERDRGEKTNLRTYKKVKTKRLRAVSRH